MPIWLCNSLKLRMGELLIDLTISPALIPAVFEGLLSEKSSIRTPTIFCNSRYFSGSFSFMYSILGDIIPITARCTVPYSLRSDATLPAIEMGMANA